MAYPTASDLRSHLVTVGMLSDTSDPLATDLKLDQKITVAISWVEGMVHRAFSSSTGVRYYDAPKYGGQTIHLDEDLLSVSYVKLSGNALTEGVNYNLKPYNETPKTSIEFLTVPLYNTIWSVGAKSIAVSGSWGNTSACPADVFQAILMVGAALCDQFLSAGMTAGTIKLGQDSFQEGGSATSSSTTFPEGGFVDYVIKKYQRWHLA